MKTKVCIVGLLLACSCSVVAEYKTESVFSTDYKCISDTIGGFNHKKFGHNLTEFNGIEEFFLTHITNIPIEGLRGYYQFNDSTKDLSEEDLRIFFEANNFYVTKPLTYIDEYGSYYIRRPEENPKAGSSYWNKCSASKNADPKKAVDKGMFYCFKESDLFSFAFNANKGQFSYSYLGTWHLNQYNDTEYFGDSSVFAFGTCKPYYR